MKLWVLLLLSLCAGLATCQLEVDPSEIFNNKCVENPQNRLGCDFFLEKAPINNDFFSISYHTNFKLITNKVEEQANQIVRQTYVATQCGTQRPSDAVLENLGVDPSKAFFVEIPLKEVGTLHQQIHPFLQMLGVEDSVAFHASPAIFPSCSTDEGGFDQCDECVDFKTAVVKDFWVNNHADVTVAFRDSFFEPVEFSETGKTFTTIRVSNDDTVTNQDFKQKAEWLYFIAAFYNLESSGHLEQQLQDFQLDCVFNSISVLSTPRQAIKNVLVMTGYFDEKFLFTTCEGNNQPFHCRLVKGVDVSVDFIQQSDLIDSSAQFSLSAEDLIAKLETDDIQVDKLMFLSYPNKLPQWELLGFPIGPEDKTPGDLTKLVDFLRNRSDNFAAFVIPNTDPWFYLRPAVPALVQQDFVKMIAPELLPTEPFELTNIGFNSDFYFFQKFPSDGKEPIFGSIDTCTDFGKTGTCGALPEPAVTTLTQLPGGVDNNAVICSSGSLLVYNMFTLVASMIFAQLIVC